MSGDQQFDKAVEDVKNLKETPSNDDLLEIYALFKQATMGDCDTPKPGLFDLKGKAKWEAWNKKKGTSKEDAKKADSLNNSFPEIIETFDRLMKKITTTKILPYRPTPSAKPGMFDFKGKAKWDAWDGKKGVGKEDAKKAYVEKVAALINSIGLK